MQENSEISKSSLDGKSSGVNIEIKNLYYSYNNKGKKIYTLENLNFSIPQGKFHVFIGENGAGKSTTIKILVGLIQNYSGDLLFNNLNIRKNYFLRNNISYIPDKAIFPNNLSLYNYLYQCTLLSRLNKNKVAIKKEIIYLLKQFDLFEQKNRNPNKMSAGQTKKVLLIRAILERANIIILDEPAANLDPTSRLMFFQELKKMQVEKNVSIFISSHIIDEVQKYANYVTFIKKGKIILSKNVDNNTNILEIYKNYYMNEPAKETKLENKNITDNYEESLIDNIEHQKSIEEKLTLKAIDEGNIDTKQNINIIKAKKPESQKTTKLQVRSRKLYYMWIKNYSSTTNNDVLLVNNDIIDQLFRNEFSILIFKRWENNWNKKGLKICSDGGFNCLRVKQIAICKFEFIEINNLGSIMEKYGNNIFFNLNDLNFFEHDIFYVIKIFKIKKYSSKKLIDLHKINNNLKITNNKFTWTNFGIV